MRPIFIIGGLLIALGAFVLLRGANFTSRRDVLKVGDVKVTADQQQTVPPWMGAAAVVVGAAIVLSGVRRKA